MYFAHKSKKHENKIIRFEAVKTNISRKLYMKKIAENLRFHQKEKKENSFDKFFALEESKEFQ